MVVRVIDIETTGIEPEIDAIIEIASVDLVRGGGVASARSTCVAARHHHTRRPPLEGPAAGAVGSYRAMPAAAAIR
jgi:DNA polymerase III epsilon subunit-like protein